MTSMAIATSTALYPTRVTHLHRSPVQHYAEHRSYTWYVDLDAVSYTHLTLPTNREV